MPKDWYDRISSIYHLTLEGKEKLKLAIDSVTKEVVLNLEKLTPQKKEFALAFARSFEELIDEEKKFKEYLVRGRRKMYNYIVEPLSRFNIRQIVKSFRKLLGIENAWFVDVVALLDILSKKIPDFSYEVVANCTLPKKVFTCTLL